MRLATVARGHESTLAFLSDETGDAVTFHRAAQALGVPLGQSLRRVADDMLAFLNAGPKAWNEARSIIEMWSQADPEVTVVANSARSKGGSGNPLTLLAPIPRPSKNIFCVGRNYAAHAKERGADVPRYPVFFTKAPTTVIGPDAVAPYPAHTKAFDYEGELGVVIGRLGKDIPADEAMEYVFGYTIINDLTARDLQRDHQQFFKGKSLDGTCPMGPMIVSRDAAPDPKNMTLETRVNGEMRQSASTGDMIFDIPTLIESLSAGMTLEPGDIIATGTPEGVGAALGRLLEPGDVVEVRISGIGTLITHIGR